MIDDGSCHAASLNVSVRGNDNDAKYSTTYYISHMLFYTPTAEEVEKVTDVIYSM